MSLSPQHLITSISLSPFFFHSNSNYDSAKFQHNSIMPVATQITFFHNGFKHLNKVHMMATLQKNTSIKSNSNRSQNCREHILNDSKLLSHKATIHLISHLPKQKNANPKHTRFQFTITVIKYQLTFYFLLYSLGLHHCPKK